MNAKNGNRLLLAVWMIYLPIAQLGATESWEQAGAAFGILAVTAILGWMERDFTAETPNKEVRGPEAASPPQAPSRLPGSTP